MVTGVEVGWGMSRAIGGVGALAGKGEWVGGDGGRGLSGDSLGIE
jgi:hypothetical protein